YLLVQEASNAMVGALLPAPDITDATPINMAAGGGKVALVSSTTPLGCNGSTTPCSDAQLAPVVDLVGLDGATFWEGSSAGPTTSATAAAFRAASGCTDTDDNGADFALGTPAPRNSASPAHDCSVVPPTSPTGTGSATPSSLTAGGSTLLSVAVTPGTNPPSSGITVTCDLTAIDGSATQTFVDDGTNGDDVAGDLVFSDSAAVPASIAPGNKSLPCTVSDGQARSSSAKIELTIEGPLEAIHDIQGASHISPFVSQVVSTNGIVTANASNGFWMQDPNPDTNDATSEGVFVFTSSAHVAVGDAVHVN